MKWAWLLIGFAVFPGTAFAASDATHAPTVIGDSSLAVSPVGYTYTDPPGTFVLPTGTARGARAHARHRIVAAHMAPAAKSRTAAR
jgi:hypothetical protein